MGENGWRTGGVTAVLTGDTRRSAGAIARERRFKRLLERFPDLAAMRVLDLGGEAQTWLASPSRPERVVLLNVPWMADIQQRRLDSAGERDITAVGGDACEPPASLRGERFDLVFSNSVIEHVGGHRRRAAFADAVHALGDHHWIQTPNRYFPIEPHWLFPGFQFLPARARGLVQRHWPIGHFADGRADKEARGRLGDVLDVELVSRTEMAWYFPESEILAERVGPLTKSLIAVR